MKEIDTASYLTIADNTSYAETIARSRFIGHCCFTPNEESLGQFITNIRNLHPGATHNCYAYRLKTTGQIQEYTNDHGEPGGSAGRPILGSISRLGLLNTTVVVTRYFGGKKLGIRGLIEAYGQIATKVLQKAGIIEKTPQITASLTHSYSDIALINHHLQQIGATIVEQHYTEQVTTIIALPTKAQKEFEKLWPSLNITTFKIIKP